jgi:hypothetical protein
MRIVLRDLIPDYFEFERAAHSLDPAERPSVWHDTYESRHPKIFASYNQMGQPPDFDQTLVRLASESDAFKARVRLVFHHARENAPRVAARFGAKPSELAVVTMVGLYRGDCWVDDLDGAPAMFFAVERFREPPWERTSVVHEAAHFMHAAVQPQRWDDQVIGLRLLMEGIAITTTHSLLPDLPEWTHFNFEAGEIDSWLRACEEALPSVRSRLRGLVASTDATETARYFSPDWLRDLRDVPEKIGYYAGAQVVEQVSRDMPISELAALHPTAALDLAKSALV